MIKTNESKSEVFVKSFFYLLFVISKHYLLEVDILRI